MRFAFPPLTPVIRATLIVLFASFVVQSVLEGMLAVPISPWIALHADLALPLAWTWATYPLVEIGSNPVIARAFDLLLIHSFGGYVEQSLGRKRTLVVILASIPAAALVPLALGLWFPSIAYPVFGATGITWALMGSFAVVTRGAPLSFFLMPPMSAWAVIGVFLALEALSSMWMRTPIPFLLAIGALGAGVLGTRWLERRGPPRRPPPRRRAGAGRLHVIAGGGENERPRWLN